MGAGERDYSSSDEDVEAEEDEIDPDGMLFGHLFDITLL